MPAVLRRVLLVRAGALGDVLLLRRAITALRRAGAEHLCLLAPARAGAALLGPGGVDEVFDWDEPRVARLLAGGSTPDVWAGFDGAVVWSRSADVVEALRPFVPAVLSRDPAPPPGVHASEWLAGALEPWRVPVDAAPAVLRPTPAERREADSLLGLLPDRFLAIHPGSGSPAKNWPQERFAALLHSLGGTPWLLVRGPADDRAADLLSDVPGAVVADRLPIRVLAAVLAEAGAFVGNDSGVTHLAAAFGAPTIALFGPTDPAVWSPVGPRVTTIRSATNDMNDIVTEEVRERIGRLKL